MLDNLPDEQSIEKLAETDPILACEKARELVAARPNEEGPALLLRKVVSQAAAQREKEPIAEDLVDAAPDVREADRLLQAGEQEQAEILLRKHLSLQRNDPPAMRLMAEIAARSGFFDNAERIARRALEIERASVSIRLTLARILFYHRGDVEANRGGERALEVVGDALELEPANQAALNLKATFLAHLRRQEEALVSFEDALRADPLSAPTWITSGIIKKTLGLVGPSVAAFRTALAIRPSNSQAWWELANLKTVKLFGSDAPLMAAALASADELDDDQRAELHFSLFKAYHDIGDCARAAEHLEAGNELKRKLNPYEPDEVTRQIDHSIATLTPEFFDARDDFGLKTEELIFVLGMYRAGSTLVEQILASHSKIEGTDELFYVLEMVNGIEKQSGKSPEDFIETAAHSQVEGLARKLIELSRTHKRTDRPYFIDKNPANWRYTGLIHTILPKARIIDVRRNPLDCCFANYAQNFHSGVAFSYGQRDLARYYADYVRLMRHFERVMPDRYHRVIYEDLVDDSETEIRRLLGFLELEFEESCLRFFETERPIYTPSAQQVRQPINRSGIDRWRPYESWLQPLMEELGDLPTTYRN